MQNEKILIIDDDAQIRKLLRDRLEANGYQVYMAEDGKAGLEMTTGNNPDLVLLDLNMPEMDGFEVLSELHKKYPELMVVILTAHGSVERAVEAMKLGAFDFLPKPCKPDHILFVVRKALERKGLSEENKYLRTELESRYQMIIGKNDEMLTIMDTAQKLAQSKTTVFIGGESGTGKQLMARAIHAMSDRKTKPLIQVNCTTLSEQLMESDIFGHEKGAFTGAIKQKKGRFELADKGTLFLDEIGDISPAIQAKLLHVLEYGEFQRVGGVDTLNADVRIIVATNKDLKKEVDEGRFREDLFYRLNVVSLKLPSLKSRVEDIPVFIEHFIKKHNQAMQKNITSITPEAMNLLKKYSWPGNIRELENAIERAVVLSSEIIISIDLFQQLVENKSVENIEVGISLDEALTKFKKQFILKTLDSTDSNQTQAAKILEIQRTYLNRLIKELKIN